jgi:hypothetical protein
LMDQTALADYKCIYYQYDIELAKYYWIIKQNH